MLHSRASFRCSRFEPVHEIRNNPIMKLLLNILLGTTAVLAASRTSPPSGCVHVAKSGGQYTTVQAAVDSLSTTSTAAQCIFIDQGTYTEQVDPPFSYRLTVVDS